MRSPTWAEYLAEATEYLAEVRRSAHTGGAPPAPPTRPDEPMPEDLGTSVSSLANDYNRLAVEVSGLLLGLEQRTATLARPRPGPLPAFYIDTSV